MRNYKFKLSDMIPNAWFYKLRDMGRARKQATSTTPSRKKKQSSSSNSTTQHSSKPKQPHHHHNQCTPRKSYYFTRELNPTTNTPNTTNSPEPPRKSSRHTTKRRTTPTTTTPSRRSTYSSPKLVSNSVCAGCRCRATLESVCTKSDSPPECYYSSSSPFDSSAETESPDPEFRTDHVLPTESSSFDELLSLSTNSCSCRLNSNPTRDIVIDVDKSSLARKDDKLDGYECDSFSELELPPIITKPAKINTEFGDAKKKETKPRTRMAPYEEHNLLKVKIVKEDRASVREQRSTPVRRSSVSSPGVKLRVNSPRIASRKVQSHGRKSVSSSGSRRSISSSFAVVKSSLNPQKDFRESMVEMIVENNIRASKDLEDLLACYLSLNSDEYHDLIIKVFKQIWFDLTGTS